jgi:hypothetical protein
MEESNKNCQYVSMEGVPCKSQSYQNGSFCFWHDSKQSKKGPSIKIDLLSWLEEGNSLDGVHLAYADLSKMKLPRSQDESLLNFRNADLNHANLSNAHLFAVDFSGSSLLKADLSGSNINRSVLDKSNLLGTRFTDTKMEDVKWGNKCLQEIEAKTQSKKRMAIKARQNFTEAEEIYRRLRIECEARGLYDDAGHFHYRERLMHQELLPRFSTAWVLSRLVQMVCGYGESAARVVAFSLGLITLCALLYCFLPLAGSQILSFSFDNSFMANLRVFGNCLYYSVVTFTTLGYGDIAPLGFAKVVAALEAFTGAFSMSLFVVVFVRKMAR